MEGERLVAFVWSFVLSLFFVQLVQCAGFQYVTCGSVLKLQHVQSNVRLHSHDVKYGSGSGQQSVTGVTHADDVNSYWVVRGPHGTQCNRGDPINCKDIIRLQHLNSRTFLHSHRFSSPLSGNQEVSAFGDSGRGDSGDNWILDCAEGAWRRDDAIRLRHKDTSMYLHSPGNTYGRPIAGQKEICAVRDQNKQSLWKAMEGVYMEPSSGKL